jgi:hypothetical protein
LTLEDHPPKPGFLWKLALGRTASKMIREQPPENISVRRVSWNPRIWLCLAGPPQADVGIYRVHRGDLGEGTGFFHRFAADCEFTIVNAPALAHGRLSRSKVVLGALEQEVADALN